MRTTHTSTPEGDVVHLDGHQTDPHASPYAAPPTPGPAAPIWGQPQPGYGGYGPFPSASGPGTWAPPFGGEPGYQQPAGASHADAGGPGEPPPIAPRPPAPRARPNLPRPGRRPALIVVVLAIGFTIAAHGTWAGVATTAMFAVAVVGLAASGAVRNRQSFALLLLVIALAAFLTLRQSVWLVPVDVVLSTALLVLAAGYATGSRVAGLTLSGLTVRFGRALASIVLAPAYALGCLVMLVPITGADRRRRLAAIARGVGIAVPVVALLGLLLASADAVFASLFRIPVDVGDITSNIVYFCCGLWAASILFVEAAREPLDEIAVDLRPLGATEAAVVLGALVALYGGFALTQVVTATGGADHVLRTAGLTYADYARQGFFQLMAVGILTLIVLLGIRAGTRPATGWARVVVVVLGEVTIAFTLVIVGVAIYRLSLYEDAYGLTMLRLAVTTVAWSLGVVFLLVGVAFAGVMSGRRWISGAIAATLVVTIVLFNAIDPEAVVARRNIDHALSSGQLDASYLDDLSDDAIPVLADGMPELDPSDRALVRARICRISAVGRRSEKEPGRGVLDYNRSAERADEVRSVICRS